MFRGAVFFPDTVYMSLPNSVVTEEYIVKF